MSYRMTYTEISSSELKTENLAYCVQVNYRHSINLIDLNSLLLKRVLHVNFVCSNIKLCAIVTLVMSVTSSRVYRCVYNIPPYHVTRSSSRKFN